MTVLDLDAATPRPAPNHLQIEEPTMSEPVTIPAAGDQPDYTTTGHPISVVLRPHQQAAYDQATGHLSEHDRVTVVMPCGTGKTLVGQRIAQEQARHGRSAILVLVPTRPLLKQTMRAWIRHSPRPLRPFVFCDDTISPEENIQAPVSTSPQALADWMAHTLHDITGPNGPQVVVFATYTSSPRIAQAHAEFGLPAFHSVVADEAHCCAGKFDAAFATVVDETKICAAVRIFLTATPRVRRSSDSTAWCMDDPRAFGPIVAPLGVQQAIDARLLSDYVVAVVAITDADVRAAITDEHRPVQVGAKTLPGEQVATQLALNAAAKTYGLRRVMVFHNTVATSKDFANTLEEVIGDELPGLISMHVDGSTTPTQRAQRLSVLAEPGRDNWAVLSNVRCLGQGIDIPAIDAVLFASPRSSAIDITQCIGRALRLDPGREDPAVIVLPVFVDSAGDIAEQVKSSKFRHVYRTLLALADHDTQLAAELASRGRGRRGGTRGGRGAHDRFVVLDAAGAPAAAQLRDAVTIRALRMLTPGWDYGYEHLTNYVEDHENARVPLGFVTKDGFPLGLWVRGNRNRRRQLADDQVAKLTELPGWAWNAHDAAWADAFERLQAFTAEHGHANVPVGHQSPDGFALATWVAAQRSDERQGILPENRRDTLTAAGFSFTPMTDRRNERITAGLDALTAFHREHGHSSPSQNHITADGFRLGSFCHSVRRRYFAGALTEYEVSALQAQPGWVWDVLEARWQAGLGELAQFHESFGHVHVPRSYVSPSGEPLGKWLHNQRYASRTNTLAAHRRAAMEALDPQWDKPLARPRLAGASNHG
ncbi:Helicase associated domain protein [Mycobacterium sp. 134]|uniref:DEAD/DEAH box helicase n=1 Tax=Mycobacterium sp. 134 TaxID=3400425 RepID=UPI003AB0D93A